MCDIVSIVPHAFSLISAENSLQHLSSDIKTVNPTFPTQVTAKNSQKTVRKQSENSKKTERKQSEKPSENGKKTVRKPVRKREENSQKNRQKTGRKQEENSSR